MLKDFFNWKQIAFYLPIIIGGIVAFVGVLGLLGELTDWIFQVPNTCTRLQPLTEIKVPECYYALDKRNLANGVKLIIGGKLFAISSVLGSKFFPSIYK